MESNSISNPLVAILIVVHNRLALTTRCLACIPAASKEARILVVVVDDGSTDGTEKCLKDNLPEAEIIHGDGNLWFSGGVQKGIDYIRAKMPQVDYVLSLNNDVFMLPGCLDALIAESNTDYVVSAMLTDIKVSLIHSFGTVWHWWKGWICPLTGDSVAEHPELIQGVSKEVGMLTTACTLIPMKWLKAIKGIDVFRYPQHKADTDLFSKLSKAGAQLRVTSRAVVTGDDGPDINRYRARDHALFDFIKDSLLNKYCPAHMPSMVRSFWESAPSRLRAIPVIIRVFFLYFRTILSFPFYRLVSALGFVGEKRER